MTLRGASSSSDALSSAEREATEDEDAFLRLNLERRVDFAGSGGAPPATAVPSSEDARPSSMSGRSSDAFAALAPGRRVEVAGAVSSASPPSGASKASSSALLARCRLPVVVAARRASGFTRGSSPVLPDLRGRSSGDSAVASASSSPVAGFRGSGASDFARASLVAESCFGLRAVSRDRAVASSSSAEAVRSARPSFARGARPSSDPLDSGRSRRASSAGEEPGFRAGRASSPRSAVALAGASNASSRAPLRPSSSSRSRSGSRGAGFFFAVDLLAAAPVRHISDFTSQRSMQRPSFTRAVIVVPCSTEQSSRQAA